MKSSDEIFMAIALEEAKRGFTEDEIPVGAVIVHNNVVIAQSHNQNRSLHNPIAHAEILAIQEAAKVFGNERLIDCYMYVTKEPCAMCAGAIVHSRIKKLFIGTPDIRFGACGTVLNVCGNDALNHKPEIVFGVLEKECKNLLQEFFTQLRLKR